MTYLFRTLWNKFSAFSDLRIRAEEETKSEKRGKFGLLDLKEREECGQPAVPAKHQHVLMVGSEDANYFTRESRKTIT